MSRDEDLDDAAFDAYIRAQLAKAADTYASHVRPQRAPRTDSGRRQQQSG
jgi:hypothetical protein